MVTLSSVIAAVNQRPEVSFCHILYYIGDRKRCLKEGEEVLKAGYFVVCGIKEEKGGHVVVHAFALPEY